jgi:O-acetyl-ADP-ribose deacetylase (regulator of RNase III)
MALLHRILRRGRYPQPPAGDGDGGGGRRWSTPAGLEVGLFVGEINDAPAEAVCISTNPRLSLGGGTGRAVLEATGWAVKRRLEAILATETAAQGGDGLPVGFTCATPGDGGRHRVVLHCVASDPLHRSSPGAVRLCTAGALARAEAEGCTSLALPVFGAGHAGLPFGEALGALAEALRDATTSLRRALVVVLQPDRAAAAAEILDGVLGPGGGTGMETEVEPDARRSP